MGLAPANVQAVLDCVEGIATVGLVPDRAIAPVSRVVPADSITYNEIDLRRRVVRWSERPVGSTALPDAAAIFAAHLAEHPLISHYRSTGDPAAHAISELTTSPALHRTGLYADFFGPRVEDQLAVTLPAGPGLLICVALNRGRRGFRPATGPSSTSCARRSSRPVSPPSCASRPGGSTRSSTAASRRWAAAS